MLGNNQRKTKTYVSVSQLSGCVLYFHCVVLMFVFTFASFLRRYNPGRSCLYTSGGVVVEEVLRNRAFPALHDILFPPMPPPPKPSPASPPTLFPLCGIIT